MSYADATQAPICSLGTPTYDQSDKPGVGPPALPKFMNTPPLFTSPGAAMLGKFAAPTIMSSMPSPLTSPAEDTDHPRFVLSSIVLNDQPGVAGGPSPRP